VRMWRRRSLFVNATLVLLFAAFAYAHFVRWLDTGRPVGLGAIFLEATVAFLFIVRSPPRMTSGRVVAWVSALVGSFAMLLARPVADPYAGPVWMFEIAQFVGFALAIVALGFLGRSFGIVAAVRRVKTRGLYGLVRHPAYAAYAIAYTGYALENPSARNFALLGIATAAQLVRIREEERVLDRDPSYRAYRMRVRYRLIPFVY
jgi:protein-S-isoprenylcysteine O-methyltransferase Ste14